MAGDEATGTGPSKPEGSSPGRSPIVFVCDASAETERIGDTFRAAGYIVADVPLANLSARVAAQRPNVVLLDVDADGALAENREASQAAGLRLESTSSISAPGDGVVKDAEDALSNDGERVLPPPGRRRGARSQDRSADRRSGRAARGSPFEPPPPSLPASRGLLGGSLRDPTSDRARSAPSLPRTRGSHAASLAGGRRCR